MINCIYLHIPFCKKKCKYCAFCSYPLISKKEIYIKSLIKEIKHFYKGNLLKTLYFGGGTPSMLDTNEIEAILDCFNFDENTEITFELNPNNVSLDYLKALKKLKINRLSLGVQSFDDNLLNEIGRIHDKKDIINSIKLIKETGFLNFSIDLMYGLADQTLENWLETLDIALEFEIPHISLYGLKIEKGTYFEKYPPKNLPDSDMQAKMYEKAVEILKKRYSHYEFSNFAISKEFYSKHNLACWNRENYFGFGLSSSGFIENKRYTNTSIFKDYLLNPIEKNYEILNAVQELEEEIFLGLRKNEGIDFKKINQKYNIDIYKKYEKLFNKFILEGFMEKTKNGVRLTLQGVLVSNEILCEFIAL